MPECIFCKIINKEIPSEIVYEDEKVCAFNDIDPKAPTHIIIIPKKHISSLNKLEDDDIEIMGSILKAVKNIAKEQKIADDGYRVVTNCGELGGQTVGHIHFHLLGGRKMMWPPG